MQRQKFLGATWKSSDILTHRSAQKKGFCRVAVERTKRLRMSPKNFHQWHVTSFQLHLDLFWCRVCTSVVVFAREACDMSRHDRVHVRWKKCPTNHKKCVSKLFSERSQLDRYFIVLEPQGYSRYSYKCGLFSFVLVLVSLPLIVFQ